MKIKYTSIFVDDQEKALKFYTEKLGFVKKSDVSANQYRWLTVVSPEDENGTELVIEPNDNPVAKTYQKAIFDQGIPATSFVVPDVKTEYSNLKNKEVKFTMEPTEVMKDVVIAILDDTCGNLVQIQQK